MSGEKGYREIKDVERSRMSREKGCQERKGVGRQGIEGDKEWEEMTEVGGQGSTEGEGEMKRRDEGRQARNGETRRRPDFLGCINCVAVQFQMMLDRISRGWSGI
jgi:hypothetical protein